MAKKAVCEGEVVVIENNAKSIEFYTEEFVLDEGVKTLAQARSIIQGGLIADRLRRNMKGYKKWRTCQVVEFSDTKEKAENSDLDKLLMEATALGCKPDNIDNYKRPDHKLKALQRAIDNHKERKAKAKPDETDKGYID